MHINMNHGRGCCEIWVGKEERETYHREGNYKLALAEAKRRGMNVCVYMGGEEPILEQIGGLLDEL